MEEKVVIPAADDDRATPLCQDRYCLVRTAINAPQPCQSCNSKPKQGEKNILGIVQH